MNILANRSTFGQNGRKVAIAITAVASVTLLSLSWVSQSNGRARELAAIGKANPAGPRLLVGSDQSSAHSAAKSYGKLPLSFELNAGQADARVKYLSRGPGYSLFLTGIEAVLSLQKKGRAIARAPAMDFGLGAVGVSGLASLLHAPHRPQPNLVSNPPSPLPAPAAFRMSLADADPAAAVTGLDELPGKTNYLIGNDPAKWQTNVPTYAKVKYEQVYRGIDLVYYGNPQQLEYDFLVAPGADPSAISLNIAALSPLPSGEYRHPLQIDPNGDLVINSGEDEVRLHKPVTYQTRADSSRHFVDGRYLLKGDHQVTFAVATYDRAKLLVIDPILSYSTSFGGSSNDVGRGIAVDGSGCAYVAGYTASTDFPTANGLQGLNGGVPKVPDAN